ncbi:hypothetical protein SAMN04487846_0641 [Microbacterium sp. cf046]|nr:hypothetical protein SAMN04487846_0641 [Microbacterium sp. cf046]
MYAGTRLMTGDEIADAVLEYCAALAEVGTAETVEIPVLTDEGVRASARLLVGPASQIVAEDVETSFDELVDSDVVSLLRSRTQSHRPVAASMPRDADDSESAWIDDY